MTATPDIWQRARDLRLLAATWRMSTPAEQIPLIVALIQATGPAWTCLGTIAPVWRGLVDHRLDVCLWWLLHTPADRPCLRCLQLGRLPERMHAAADGADWCAYHLGGRLADVSVGTDDGITVVTRAGVRA